MAALGLRRQVREHYLSVIEGRCSAHQNGASWQVEVTEKYEAAGHSRNEALHLMFGHYVEHMEQNQPVHTWPIPDVEQVSGGGSTPR